MLCAVQTLAERHVGELSALEAACRHEYEALAARWDADLRCVSQQTCRLVCAATGPASSIWRCRC